MLCQVRKGEDCVASLWSKGGSDHAGSKQSKDRSAILARYCMRRGDGAEMVATGVVLVLEVSYFGH